MSGELWFAEGFTDYYAPLVLKRAGLMIAGRVHARHGQCGQYRAHRAGTRSVQRGRYEPAGGVRRWGDLESIRRIRPIPTFRITPTAAPSRWASTWRFGRSFPASRWMTGCARCGAGIPMFRSLIRSRTWSRRSRRPPAAINSRKRCFSGTSKGWSLWSTPLCWRTPASCCSPHRLEKRGSEPRP